MVLQKSLFYIPFYELKYRILGKKYIANIDITDRCNLRCKHCYNRNILKLKEDIPLIEWEKRFQKYKEIGVRQVYLVGGEPSLRYDVMKLSEDFFDFIYTSTNGQIKIPLNFKHRIFLSLDGLKEENDKLRGEGSFKNAISNYRNDKRVIVWSVLSKINYRGKERLKEFIDFIREMGVQGINIEFYTPLRKENDSLLLTEKKKEEIAEVLIEELQRKDSTLFITKKVIDHMLFFSKEKDKKCSIKNKAYMINTKNQRKTCFNSDLDCLRCSSTNAYSVSLFHFLEFISYYSKKYKFVFKID